MALYHFLLLSFALSGSQQTCDRISLKHVVHNDRVQGSEISAFKERGRMGGFGVRKIMVCGAISIASDLVGPAPFMPIAVMS